MHSNLRLEPPKSAGACNRAHQISRAEQHCFTLTGMGCQLVVLAITFFGSELLTFSAQYRHYLRVEMSFIVTDYVVYSSLSPLIL